MKYNFASIEKKWQKKWESSKAFKTKSGGKKKKCYVLEMFPYPSAEGLHMGHALNYSIGDIYARFKRMKGFNVLYPMGFDALGLPAENAAIKAKAHPKTFTEKAIKNYVRQMKELGLSYDWSRLVTTMDPEYYKWNQYFFLEFLKKGLIYKKKSPVNWCPKCKTVLANEQVINGRCWRHEIIDVEVKNLEQWFLKTTKYADELLSKIDGLDWPEKIKTMQKNWIGKSHGVDIYFKLEDSEKIFPTYTTRCDTIYSVTFLAIAPESPLVEELVKGTKQEKEVLDFSQKLAKEALADRINESKEKEGIFIGKYAINPVNNEKVPIYVSNFALMYGSGVVMCDAHDKRDFRFARKYKIPLKFVISKDGKSMDPKNFKDAFVEDGILFNSGRFSGIPNKKALPEIAKWLEKKKYGKRVVNYKLRDWGFSRQRYWGTPIPIVYCDRCGTVPLGVKDLPVKLPDKVKFGKGNPLTTNIGWLKTKCPKCKGKARRETDTMDTFFDSSWYYLRYIDNKNKKAPFDKKKVKYWMPVDQYIGGAEHACMHLIYARFFTKVLRDLGYLNFREPFTRLFNQGMLHGLNGEKMSKSKGNVVNPDVVSKKYGMDTARFFLLSLALPDKQRNWSEEGIRGSLKFVEKIMDYFNNVKIGEADPRTLSKLNKAIKEVTRLIEDFKFNLAIIEIRGLFESLPLITSKGVLQKSLQLLHPICPHITEELWQKVKGKGLISLSSWPKADLKKINKKFEIEDAAKDKIVFDIMNIIKIVEARKEKKSKVYVYVLPKELELYDEKEISMRVGKPVKVFSVADKKKYDPTNKSKNTKPGKPGIYLD